MLHIPTSDEEFNTLIESSNKMLVVVDFKATWCKQCSKIQPFFARLPSKYQNAVFTTIDVDTFSTHPEVIDVELLPTFKLYKNRKVIATLSGAKKTQLETLINQHIST